MQLPWMSERLKMSLPFSIHFMEKRNHGHWDSHMMTDFKCCGPTFKTLTIWHTWEILYNQTFSEASHNKTKIRGNLDKMIRPYWMVKISTGPQLVCYFALSDLTRLSDSWGLKGQNNRLAAVLLISWPFNMVLLLYQEGLPVVNKSYEYTVAWVDLYKYACSDLFLELCIIELSDLNKTWSVSQVNS